jgi:hypothetical protein
MNWSKLQKDVEKMIKKNGLSVSIIKEVLTGSYNATLDTLGKTAVTYDNIKIVLKNPTNQNQEGTFGKSDKLQALIPAIGVPTLDKVPFKIVSGNETWFPEKTVAIKPAGITVLFIVDLK